MSAGRGLPAGTLTFLFTDIEGSTKLQTELGTDRYQDVLEIHTRILRDAFNDGGVEIRMEGDALFVVFPVAAKAVRAAAAAQRALATATFPHGATVRVRMGMHTGEGRPATAEAGADYVGIDVNRAARVAAAGHGGQVLVTDATATLVRPELGNGVSLRDLGEYRLKDLANPEHLYQLVIAGCAINFPPLRTLDQTAIFLPTQPSTFIGRTREIAEGRRLLEKARLVTLTGPGGTGKTRLSLRIAEEAAGSFGDGTFFVPLAAISDPELVPSTIAHSLGVQLSGAEVPLTRVLDHVRGKKMLLVLDNFEQILPAAPVVGQLLGASAALRVIASSRAPLRIAGEQEFPVPPLDLPDPERLPSLEVLTQSDAVRLFVERAMAIRPDFRVTPENAAAVAEIVSRLDGLPLAIELAAARIKVLTPQAMLPKLRQGLDMLASTARDLPERQRTLRGAIAWSWDLLSESERKLFARLAVFVGGGMLPQIEVVCGPSSDLGGDVLELLSALIEHSLIRQSEVDGQPRFRMLVTIREYALDRLAASGEADEMNRRHAATFLALADEARPHFAAADQKTWLDAVDRDDDNFRAALEWTIAHGLAAEASRLVFALWRFWQRRGHLLEGANWCDRVVALPEDGVDPIIRMRAFEATGGLAYWLGKFAVAQDAYGKANEIAKGVGDPAEEANAAYNLAFSLALPMDDVPGALDLLRGAREKWTRLGDPGGVARSSWALGSFLQLGPRGTVHPVQLAEGLKAAEKALALNRTIGNRFDLAYALHLTSVILYKLGRYAESRRDLMEAVEIFREDRDISGLALIASDFAELAAAEGQDERRAVLTGIADTFARISGTGLLDNFEAQEHRWLPRNVPADLRSALERGLAMKEPEAIAYMQDHEISRD
jgi:predicted ATPase/class 3 adenylate cyclase